MKIKIENSQMLAKFDTTPYYNRYSLVTYSIFDLLGLVWKHSLLSSQLTLPLEKNFALLPFC